MGEFLLDVEFQYGVPRIVLDLIAYLSGFDVGQQL
jgi:hypothetical protein